MLNSLTQMTVPFHSAELYLIEHNEQPYTPMKPIVEGMGLDWASQFNKLKQKFASTIAEIAMVANDGKERLMICLPVRKLPAWLYSINQNKVKPEIRETVIKYQNECDDVLWDYWTKGQALNKRHVINDEQQATLQEIVYRRSNGERKIYAEMWSRHNRHFKIPRYSALLAIHFDDAVTYLEEMKIKAIKQVEEQPKPPLNIHDFVNSQQNEVMSYVWSLRQQIEALGGKLTELPFDQDMIVRGFLGHFLNGKRMMLNFSDHGIDMSFVEHNSLTLRDEEIANIIAHESRIQKNLLPDIIDAAVKRLSK